MSSSSQSPHPREKPSVKGTHNRSKVVLDVDLNAYPDGISAPFEVSVEAPEAEFSRPSPASASAQGGSVQQARLLIDVDAIDEDVVLLSSSRRISQVLNRSRRPNPVTIFLDDDFDVHPTSSGTAIHESISLNPNACVRDNLILSLGMRNISCETSDNVRSRCGVKRKKVANDPEPPKVKLKEPIFSCAVCWGELVDETSTICGHIFCQECIKKAIKVQKKCPTCRRSLNIKSIHRIYLPTTN